MDSDGFNRWAKEHKSRRGTMGLDVYFRRDIANVLRAVAVSGSRAILEGGTQAQKNELQKAYQLGRQQSLVAVGLAFGLERVEPGAPDLPPIRQRNSDGPKWIEAGTSE